MRKSQIAALVAISLGSSVAPALAQKLGGSLVIDANSLPDGAWKYHHGKTVAGEQVNSPRSMELGDTTLLQDESRASIIGLPTAEMEVFAAQFAAGKGYTVTPPATQ